MICFTGEWIGCVVEFAPGIFQNGDLSGVEEDEDKDEQNKEEDNSQVQKKSGRDDPGFKWPDSNSRSRGAISLRTFAKPAA